MYTKSLLLIYDFNWRQLYRFFFFHWETCVVFNHILLYTLSGDFNLLFLSFSLQVYLLGTVWVFIDIQIFFSIFCTYLCHIPFSIRYKRTSVQNACFHLLLKRWYKIHSFAAIYCSCSDVQHFSHYCLVHVNTPIFHCSNYFTTLPTRKVVSFEEVLLQ